MSIERSSLILYLSADQLLMVTLQGPLGGGGGLLRYKKYHMAATVTLHFRSTPPDSRDTQLLLMPRAHSPLCLWPASSIFSDTTSKFHSSPPLCRIIKAYLICEFRKSGTLWPLGQPIVSSRSRNWPCSIKFWNWLGLDFLLVVFSFRHELVETRCPKWRSEKNQ